MRNKQIRQPALPLELVEQIDDLRANGDIQRGDGFVCHDKIRIHDKAPRNADALALPAGKFMREAGGKVFGKAHFLHDLLHFAQPVLLVIEQMIVIQAFGDNVIHLCALVERGHRILKDHLHFHMKMLHLIPVKPSRDRPILIEDAAVHVAVINAHDRPADGRLA